MSKAYWVVSPFVLMLLAWVLIFISFPPFDLSFVGLFAIIPLYLLWQRVSRHDALQLGGMFGLLIGVCLAWGVFAYSQIAFFIVLFAIVSLYALLFAACARYAKSHSLWSPLHVALVWTLVDVIISALGIPYSYALVLTNLSHIIQPAHLGGEHLVTLLVVYVQAACASIMFTSSYVLTGKRSWLVQVLLLLVPLSIVAWSNISGNFVATGTLRVAAVQTSFHPYRYVLMAADGVLGQNQREIDALEQQVPDNIDLVVWPELAVRGYFFRKADATIVSSANYQLVNSPDLDRRGVKQIRSFLLDGQGNVLRVNGKGNLIPLIERGVISGRDVYTAEEFAQNDMPLMTSHQGQAANLRSTLSAASSMPIPLICYESAIPTATTRRVGDAGFIVVQTSDAFAGPSLIAELNYRHAILRAVENRRTVVRSANGGITAFISARGQVMARLSLFESDVLAETITLYQGATLFSRQWENWLVFFVIAGLSSYLWSQPWRVDTPIERRRGRTNLIRFGVVLATAGMTIFVHSKALSMQYNGALDMAERNTLPSQRRVLYTPFFANAANLNLFSYAQLSSNRLSESFYYSMAFLLRSYGNDVSGEQVSEYAASLATDADDVQNITLDADMLNALVRHYGYEFTAVSIDSPSLSLPALARMSNGEHVVVEEIGGDEVSFFSPVNGRIRLSRAYFYDRLAVNSVVFMAPYEQPWDANQ